ncbi:hypothetical protein J5N97_003057 [Dioscorea zingiberensis]|uniref:protein disulfide-isomerase n=1 Tax=Dioscorea zingiberensis TaxID=325984 RepID=A0A9D5D3Z2_9LILI|nr:hypothetical protein J5N97_003057 [Dioscorea zingiberensis]
MRVKVQALLNFFFLYEKAATILSKHEPPVILAKILRNKGKSIQDYKGPREADGIVEYLKKQVGPASFEIKSSDDASEGVSRSSPAKNAKLLPHGDSTVKHPKVRLFKPLMNFWLTFRIFKWML